MTSFMRKKSYETYERNEIRLCTSKNNNWARQVGEGRIVQIEISHACDNVKTIEQ